MIVVEIHTSHVIKTYTPPANRLQALDTLAPMLAADLYTIKRIEVSDSTGKATRVDFFVGPTDRSRPVARNSIFLKLSQRSIHNRFAIV